MRRAIWLSMVMALVILACGEDATTTTAAGETTTAEQTTTSLSETATTLEEGTLEGVSLALWGGSSSEAETTSLNDLLAEFNDATGAQASFVPQSDFDTALNAALAGGEPPDVIYVGSDRLPDLADAGQLEAIPDGALSSPNDIFPSLREAFTYNGTWYCPPKDFSTLGLVYDPAALDAAGVAVPTTWEELAAAAEALTTGDQAGLAMGVEYPRWAVFMFQAGADLTNPEVTEITLDSDGTREALRYLTDRYRAGHFVRPDDVGAGWAGEAFGDGKAAMAIEGNWIAGYLQETFPDKEWAVAELPTGPAGPGTFAFTVCYAVPAGAANPEASWALIEFLTNAEGSLAWTNAFNVMPARESVIDDWVSAHPELEAFASGAEYAHRWGFAPGFNDVIGVFNDNANGIVDGDVDIDTLIDEVVSAAEDLVQ